MSSSYSEKLRDPRWQKKRLAIMNRDGFACRDCKSSTNTLNVHHCHYQRGEPWGIADVFLLTLCEECHVTRGDLESEAKRSLALIMSRMDPNELAEIVGRLSHFARHPDERMNVFDDDIVSEFYQELQTLRICRTA